ncbi:MAG TPA: NUMOD3 domain-containing DNA-binding protein [Methanosarcinales archaeon]|nr:NUMOD3 domain-containing DNA-binding protein [Methanosarcinales archaeon]
MPSGVYKHTKGWKPTKEQRRNMSLAHMGHKPTKATRLKLSKARRLRKTTRATRRKMSKAQSGSKNPNYGKSPTKATRRKLSKALMGRKSTNVSKRKISNAHIGMKHTKASKLKMSKAHTGISLTREHRRNIIKALIGNKYMLGRCAELSNAWQGGLSFEPYSIEFNRKLKRKIRKRDKNICQLCNKRKYKRELSVHHIDYNKKNCKEGNLTSLHNYCNIMVNTNRDYWFAYFTYKMNAVYYYE